MRGPLIADGFCGGVGRGAGGGGPSFGRRDLNHLFHSIPGVMVHHALTRVDQSRMLDVACWRLCCAQSGLHTVSYLRVLMLNPQEGHIQ